MEKAPHLGKVVLVTGGSGFIGSHFICHMLREGYQVVNVDIVPPKDAALVRYHRAVSIMNLPELIRVMLDSQPNYVVHFAALAVMGGKSLNDYIANTEGTGNLLTAVGGTRSVERLIVTSTQHVRRPGSSAAAHDEDYDPLMLYGESKVITEQLTRKAGLNCCWTIVRPTTVWGPGSLELAKGLWRLIAKGWYVHPSADKVLRSYGYVKNVVWQIAQLLSTEKSLVDRKVFYVADGNFRQIDWVNAFSQSLTGSNVHTVPLWAIRGLSKVGDGVRSFGFGFPMYQSRLMNLITNNAVPVDPILSLLGKPPYSLEAGVTETVDWFRKFKSG